MHAGHGPKTVGAIRDPTLFTHVMEVAPSVLGPRDGFVAADLVEPGCALLELYNRLFIPKCFGTPFHGSWLETEGRLLWSEHLSESARHSPSRFCARKSGTGQVRPSRSSLFTRDEARRIAINMAKMPQVLRKTWPLMRCADRSWSAGKRRARPGI